MTARVHGGAGADGPLRWDFSTCANAAGPSPAALAAVQAADPTRYPDPASTAVRRALAELHGVAPWRVVPAASASEFIQRMTAVSGRLWPGPVAVPQRAYGDYAAAARAWGRRVVADDDGGAAGDAPTLRWHAEPSSPLGEPADPPADPGAVPTVLDAVYAPLRLTGTPGWGAAACERSFVLHSPNKALGLTGVRGAYAIAPREAGYDLERCCQALHAAAPSWPLSAQGDALLRSWAEPAMQAWVAGSIGTLARWTAELRQGLRERGFVDRPGIAPFFVAEPPWPIDPARLRLRGVGVRDTASFGLPGAWRVSAQPPEARQALLDAIDATRR